MHRRNLTKIEIKIEDIQDFEKLKKEDDFDIPCPEKAEGSKEGNPNFTSAGGTSSNRTSSPRLTQRQLRIGFRLPPSQS